MISEGYPLEIIPIHAEAAIFQDGHQWKYNTNIALNNGVKAMVIIALIRKSHATKPKFYSDFFLMLKIFVKA